MPRDNEDVSARSGEERAPGLISDQTARGLFLGLFAILLLPISLAPYYLGMSGGLYAMGAGLGGLALLTLAVLFAMKRTDELARALFLGSITYLPLLWLMLLAL